MTTPKRPLWFALSTFLLAFALSACQTSGPTTAGNSSQTLAPSASAPATAPAQASGPTFGNPSPTAGSSTSEKANAAADAYFQAESKLDSLSLEAEALEAEVTDLQVQVAALQERVQQVAVNRFTRSDTTTSLLLNGFASPEEQMQVAALSEVITRCSISFLTR